MHQPLPQSVSVGPRHGESITDRPQREVRILVAGDDHLTMTWSRYGHGERGPDLHVHREHTDAFYVLSGTLTLTLGPDGERTVVAPAGSVVVVPPDVPHAFVNEGADDALFLNVHTPDCGFATYMRALRDRLPASFDSYDLPVDGTRTSWAFSWTSRSCRASTSGYWYRTWSAPCTSISSSTSLPSAR